MIRELIVGVFGLLVATLASGSSLTSPTGDWRALDSHTGTPLAVIDIYKHENEFFGKIIKTLGIKQPDTRVCSACDGDRKDAPIIGLVVLEHMKHVDGNYRGGTILDPQSGKIFRCKFYLRDHGRKIVVRGFVGFALFGRSQTWLREP